MTLPLGVPREQKPIEENAAATETATEVRRAEKVLRAAIADPHRECGFLPLAEQAVRACPGDGGILLLAATAALLDRNCQRAQTFLKRFSKRFVTVEAYHLLRALALAQGDKLTMVRSVLEVHGLSKPFHAFLNFPAGVARQAWLYDELERIFERRKAARRKT
jgi:hypothetical protein